MINDDAGSNPFFPNAKGSASGRLGEIAPANSNQFPPLPWLSLVPPLLLRLISFSFRPLLE